jgi:hypothetical protein
VVPEIVPFNPQQQMAPQRPPMPQPARPQAPAPQVPPQGAAPQMPPQAPPMG